MSKKKPLNFNKISKHKFNSIEYRLLWKSPPSKKNIGECEAPTDVKPRIWVNPEQTSTQFLDTVIHESLHASFFYLDEETVSRAATDIATLLIKMGYKLPAPKPSP